MALDDFAEKTKKAIDEGASKIDKARKSPKATEVRETVVQGVDKFLTMLLPGKKREELEGPKPVVLHPEESGR